jgi:hypothetical protein
MGVAGKVGAPSLDGVPVGSSAVGVGKIASDVAVGVLKVTTLA